MLELAHTSVGIHSGQTARGRRAWSSPGGVPIRANPLVELVKINESAEHQQPGGDQFGLAGRCRRTTSPLSLQHTLCGYRAALRDLAEMIDQRLRSGRLAVSSASPWRVDDKIRSSVGICQYRTKIRKCPENVRLLCPGRHLPLLPAPSCSGGRFGPGSTAHSCGSRDFRFASCDLAQPTEVRASTGDICEPGRADQPAPCPACPLQNAEAIAGPAVVALDPGETRRSASRPLGLRTRYISWTAVG